MALVSWLSIEIQQLLYQILLFHAESTQPKDFFLRELEVLVIYANVIAHILYSLVYTRIDDQTLTNGSDSSG